MLSHPFFKHIDKLIPKNVYTYAIGKGFVPRLLSKSSANLQKTPTSACIPIRQNSQNISKKQTPIMNSPDIYSRAVSIQPHCNATIIKIVPSSPGKGFFLRSNREPIIKPLTPTARGLSLQNINPINRQTAIGMNSLRKNSLSPQKVSPVAPVLRREQKPVAQAPIVSKKLSAGMAKAANPISQAVKDKHSISIFIPFRH